MSMQVTGAMPGSDHQPCDFSSAFIAYWQLVLEFRADRRLTYCAACSKRLARIEESSAEIQELLNQFCRAHPRSILTDRNGPSLSSWLECEAGPVRIEYLEMIVKAIVRKEGSFCGRCLQWIAQNHAYMIPDGERRLEKLKRQHGIVEDYRAKGNRNSEARSPTLDVAARKTSTLLGGASQEQLDAKFEAKMQLERETKESLRKQLLEIPDPLSADLNELSEKVTLTQQDPAYIDAEHNDGTTQLETSTQRSGHLGTSIPLDGQFAQVSIDKEAANIKQKPAQLLDKLDEPLEGHSGLIAALERNISAQEEAARMMKQFQQQISWLVVGILLAVILLNVLVVYSSIELRG